jgi:hypothetical protein
VEEMSNPLLASLTRGDRRSIGRSNEVVERVLGAPELFGALFEGLHNANPLVRMRTADALEKVSARHPNWLTPYKDDLLRFLGLPEQKEVRWHLVQMVARLPLNDHERAETLFVLKGYLSDDSSIVKTSTMQAIADLVASDERLHAETIRLFESLIREGTPAMKSRGRNLLKGFGIESPSPTRRSGGTHRKQDAPEL